MPVGVTAPPTMGLFSLMPPSEPWNWASPCVNTPPSDANRKYPRPEGV